MGGAPGRGQGGSAQADGRGKRAMTGNENPLVSIGMPVYNGERHIREALDSLLRQDYRHFELIILDNASTDRTGEVCAGYAAKDPRIRYRVNESMIPVEDNF